MSIILTLLTYRDWWLGRLVFESTAVWIVTSRRITDTVGILDHVVPFHAPKGTPAEWMDDPFGLAGNIYTGPGKTYHRSLAASPVC